MTCRYPDACTHTITTTTTAAKSWVDHLPSTGNDTVVIVVAALVLLFFGSIALLIWSEK